MRLFVVVEFNQASEMPTVWHGDPMNTPTVHGPRTRADVRVAAFGEAG